MAGNHAEEKVIRGLIDDWRAALGRGDAAGLAVAYADDVAFASLAPPLWSHGKQTYIAAMVGWFSTFDGPLKGELEKLSIVAGDSVAFVRLCGLSYGGSGQSRVLCGQQGCGSGEAVGKLTTIEHRWAVLQQGCAWCDWRR